MLQFTRFVNFQANFCIVFELVIANVMFFIFQCNAASSRAFNFYTVEPLEL